MIGRKTATRPGRGAIHIIWTGGGTTRTLVNPDAAGWGIWVPRVDLAGTGAPLVALRRPPESELTLLGLIREAGDTVEVLASDSDAIAVVGGRAVVGSWGDGTGVAVPFDVSMLEVTVDVVAVLARFVGRGRQGATDASQHH